MPECSICGAFKFNKDCTQCRNNNRVDKSIEHILADDGGLNTTEWQLRYNFIKGKIAEVLIQELFLSHNYNVYRYGMEHTVPGMAELLKGINTNVALQIRKMPDFVIQKDKNVFFIEVKFRVNETFKIFDLDLNYPYDNAYIVLVSKKDIKCITINELRVGKEISPECDNHLRNRKEFNLNNNIVFDFCRFAERFFAQV